MFNLIIGFEIENFSFRSSNIWRSNETNDENNKCFTLIPLLNYGICTPDSCTNYDVKKIFELGHFFNFKINAITCLSLSRIQKTTGNVRNDDQKLPSIKRCSYTLLILLDCWPFQRLFNLKFQFLKLQFTSQPKVRLVDKLYAM